jgi:transcription elongation factor/antiterminator RfaH
VGSVRSDRRGAVSPDLHGHRWFVVCARPHSEQRAVAHLRNQGFSCFLPLHEKTVRHARQFRVVKAALFPRYLFIKLDLERDRWRSVLGTQGVSHLIMEGQRPKPAPPGVVEALSAAADGDGMINRPPEMRAGDVVRLQSGPFAGLVGKLLTLDDNGRVTVLMSFLGAPTVVRSTRMGLVPAA